MGWRIAAVRAVTITAVTFLVATCVVAIQIAVGFNGRCGGFLPALSDARSCSLWEYLWFNLSFTGLVVLHDYWWIGLASVGAVFIGSVLFERVRA